MKRLICVLFISLGILACDSKQGWNYSGEGTEFDNNGDTTAILRDLNRLGGPREGLPPQGASDTLSRDRILVNNEVPVAVRQKIRNDATFNNKRVTRVRKFDKEEVTFYEITFEGERSDNFVFNQYGGIDEIQ